MLTFSFPSSRTLTTAQKKNFISAIKCIQTKRSLFPAGQVPGSKGLFEDFAAVHINQTLFIHYSVSCIPSALSAAPVNQC